MEGTRCSGNVGPADGEEDDGGAALDVEASATIANEQEEVETESLALRGMELAQMAREGAAAAAGREVVPHALQGPLEKRVLALSESLQWRIEAWQSAGATPRAWELQGREAKRAEMAALLRQIQIQKESSEGESCQSSDNIQKESAGGGHQDDARRL